MNSVHKFKCVCEADNYGSSKRTLHTRINEHINPTPSQTKTAIYQHLETCTESNNYTIKVHDTGRDCIDTRIREAIYIVETKPKLNKRDPLAEWIEEM